MKANNCTYKILYFNAGNSVQITTECGKCLELDIKDFKKKLKNRNCFCAFCGREIANKNEL